ncbi:hypothetical protein [Robertkochia aurantiaca]|uniref:hypothetical protein n=1 Tax=Robertkochia aurantiaca TaxID=2873700 RepID=UPI001CD02D62|nr:hypothetical protein [Robertkochia sp. 3YJGBD-33]
MNEKPEVDIHNDEGLTLSILGNLAMEHQDMKRAHMLFQQNIAVDQNDLLAIDDLLCYYRIKALKAQISYYEKRKRSAEGPGFYFR